METWIYIFSRYIARPMYLEKPESNLERRVLIKIRFITMVVMRLMRMQHTRVNSE